MRMWSIRVYFAYLIAFYFHTVGNEDRKARLRFTFIHDRYNDKCTDTGVSIYSGEFQTCVCYQLAERSCVSVV
jgi:hypothetical protein